MSEHLNAEQLLALVALPEDDAERQHAQAHIARCAQCAAQWREHEAMLNMLDASFAPPAISPALAARVHASVQPRRWPRLLLLSTWLASLLLVLLPAQHSSALAAAVGSRCALSEAAFAVAPLGIAAWLSHAGRIRLDVGTFASIGAVAGVAGQWWLRAHCEVHGATLHAFVFHFLVVFGVSIAGGALGERFLALRP